MVNGKTIRVLSRNLILTKNHDVSLQWLIGSPFFPQFTIISTLRCLRSSPSDPLSPDFSKEADDLRSLIIKGFHVIGALIIGKNGDLVQIAKQAINAACKLREILYNGDDLRNFDVIGGVSGSSSGELKFFCANLGDLNNVEDVESILYEEKPENYIWEKGCLLKCELPIKLPVYVPANNNSDAVGRCLNATEELATLFRDPRLTFILEVLDRSSDVSTRSVIIRGSELDFQIDNSKMELFGDTAKKSEGTSLCCSYFCSDSKPAVGAESADTIQVTPLINKSRTSPESAAPMAEYCPAPEEALLRVVDYKLEVICYAVKNLPLSHAVSKLLIPALVDQLTTMKNIVAPSFLDQHPQLHPYHFCPPGILHPITVFYELSYGETELKQVEARRALHLRLGLPSDRPLLRIANALRFAKSAANEGVSARKGYSLLKDVHAGIPSSGVSGGLVSLVQGSYEYHHYLQDGFDDSGWGCAYRSLQTIISWFRLQHYTSINVPTHREIQEALVEIGDKDPSFIGSREWIGAIELSFVLDKLLGATCKVVNVRSGAELPEKCRELALHFENQGTPIMIGGGVLAYTLLGVDYNDASGDCAFLILDPHYTGSEDIKKIINGGWCGWKKAVDSKGKSFFLADRFYNLLLPQRPNMV
ncbi:hypothetical protein BVRB_7g176880 [Beta vulgaris subsp. vulgaris]|uniref:probable Ufm1-specific protease n=1 Tax=Beta vulgaris subsp. vulgaris TaxID=3555 RepID=UPI00053F617A|nr:probable Ufm1-specific protease [Beta vulgaris subsp. vulgaris]KMS97240.1 hypothetical protein BVRB_7g176880 [Beta vulgaris subsp. vulgaris]